MLLHRTNSSGRLRYLEEPNVISISGGMDARYFLNSPTIKRFSITGPIFLNNLNARVLVREAEIVENPLFEEFLLPKFGLTFITDCIERTQPTPLTENIYQIVPKVTRIETVQNRNTTAVSMLATLGYPLPCIRKALHKLTGLSQPELARRLGVSRPTVTATIDGSRGSNEIKSAIAEAFDVPVEVLFEPKSDSPGA